MSTEPVEQRSGLSAKVLIIGVLLLAGSFYWMRHVGMISHGSQLGESVPVIPAIAALILLTLIAPLTQKLPEMLRLSRADVLALYVFVAIGASMASVGVVGFSSRTSPRSTTSPSPRTSSRATSSTSRIGSPSRTRRSSAPCTSTRMTRRSRGGHGSCR